MTEDEPENSSSSSSSSTDADSDVPEGSEDGDRATGENDTSGSNTTPEDASDSDDVFEVDSGVSDTDTDLNLQSPDVEAVESVISGEGSDEELADAIQELTADSDTFDITTQDIETSDYTSEFLREVVPIASTAATYLESQYDPHMFWRPENIPVRKGIYTLEHFKIEEYYTDYDYETFTGTQPTAGEGRFKSEDAAEDGTIPFDATEFLGFHQDETETWTAQAKTIGEAVEDVVTENTVDIQDDIDEDDFFTTFSGEETIVSRYDLEKTIPKSKKHHFEEIERYWVNKPFAFVVIYHSTKENETKYYVVEPYLNSIEENVFEYLIEKLQNTIKYAGEGAVEKGDDDVGRANVIETETDSLLRRYGVYQGADSDLGAKKLFQNLKEILLGNRDPDHLMRTETEASMLSNEVATEERQQELDETEDTTESSDGVIQKLREVFESQPEEQVEIVDVDRNWVYLQPEHLRPLDGQSVRPEPVVLNEDGRQMSEYQVQKLLYYLKRDFIGYQRIDAIKNDINVEDISVDGYNSPVFVYHTDYEQIISNVYHGERDLDEFVVKLAQRSGKGISKRQPQVDATLPDGSRAQLTLGKEVSDHGTNYTIRQFKDVPFTPIDLINWHTFSLDQMAFLWLCIENHKSLIFAGGTASGKTTSLNAISLFIPSTAKIVSIEDTREVELPQRNWIASVTRPSFSDEDKGDVDEFDLLEAALRQRPDYIVMGEIRGEEGRTLFQVMSTGHTTYTTFHADSVDEVLKRFTTDPINVSKTMFTALDLVSIQTQTRVQGNKVRRNKNLTEVNGYNAENNEINVQDVYQWQAETDQFMQIEGSNTLEKIKFDRGWTQSRLEEELFRRRVVLAHLIDKGLNEYAQVAATLQAFIHDPDTILKLIAQDKLDESLSDLRDMESVLIDIDQEKEDMVPRPTPDRELEQEIAEILDEAQETLFADMETNMGASDLADALSMDESAPPESPADSDTALDLIGDEDMFSPVTAQQPDADELTAETDEEPDELEVDDADFIGEDVLQKAFGGEETTVEMNTESDVFNQLSGTDKSGSAEADDRTAEEVFEDMTTTRDASSTLDTDMIDDIDVDLSEDDPDEDGDEEGDPQSGWLDLDEEDVESESESESEDDTGGE